MKLLLNIVALLVAALQLEAQTWSRTYEWGLNVNGTTCVTALSNGNAVSINLGLLPDRHFRIFEVNHIGDTLWSKVYSKPGRSYLGGLSGSLVQTVDNGYAWCAQETDSVNNGDALVVRFNDAGDTLWTARFGSTQLDGAFALSQLPDSGFAVFGTTDSTDRDPFIWRLDKDGQTQWVQILGTTDVESCWSGLHALDDGFVLSGTIDISVSRKDVHLIKCDTAGNMLWEETYGGLYRDNWSFVTELANGDLLLATGIGQVPFPGNFKQSALIRTDASGNEIWTQIYSDPQWTTFTTKPLILPNGDFVIAGGKTEFVKTAFCSMIEANGNKVWDRRYVSTEQRDQYLYDVQATPDGGFILAGQAFDTLVTSQDAWLVKVDSFGCIVPGCQTIGIEEQVTDLGDVLQIFPNPVPSGGYVSIELDLPAQHAPNDLRLAVVNASGRLVHEQQVQGQNCRLQTADWPPGLYYLHLSHGSRWLSGTKLMVE